LDSAAPRGFIGEVRSVNSVSTLSIKPGGLAEKRVENSLGSRTRLGVLEMGVLDIRPVIVEESSREPGGVLVPTEEESPTGGRKLGTPVTTLTLGAERQVTENKKLKNISITSQKIQNKNI
jgi:hypothetical protein